MEPAGYQIKRYFLMGLCVLSIIVLIVVAALSGKIIGEADKEIDAQLDQSNTHITQKDREDIRDLSHKIIIGVLIAACILGILFNLLGLIAAWKEHFCLAITYTVLHCLGLVQLFWQSVRRPVMFANFGFQFVVALVAILFVIDLSKIRRSRLNGPAQRY